MADPTRTESPSEAGSIQVVTNQAPDTISAIEGVISNEDAEKQTERLVNLFRTTQDNRICVLHDDRKWQLVAEKILLWYQEKNIACELLVYTKPGWIDEIKGFSHFIFLGLPPYDRGRRGLRLRSPKSPTDGSQMEMSYFMPVPNGGNGGLQINNVVVVIREPINTKHQYKQKVSGHYLEHYLILDGKRKQPSVLAASSLGVFAGTLKWWILVYMCVTVCVVDLGGLCSWAYLLFYSPIPNNSCHCSQNFILLFFFN